MQHLRKLESSFEDIRTVGENQDWLGTPVTHDVSVHKQRPQGTLYQRLVLFLLRTKSEE